MNNPNQRLIYPFPMFYNPNMKIPQNEPKQQPIYYMMVPYMMYDPNNQDIKDKNNNNINFSYYPYITPQNFQVPNEQGQDYPYNQIPYGFPMMQMYPINPNYTIDKNNK